MTDGVASALAGLGAIEARIGVTAERLAKAALADPEAGASTGDLVDLSTEAVSLLQSQAGYETLVNLIRAEEELAKSTLSLLA